MPAFDWRAHAACRGEPVDTFFSPNTARAKEICAGCPVIADCLEESLRQPAAAAFVGVFGGLTGEERRALVRHRSAGEEAA